MFECINDDWSKVLGELWSFPLAVLDDVIGQIQEGQLARYLSCTCLKKNKETHIISDYELQKGTTQQCLLMGKHILTTKELKKNNNKQINKNHDIQKMK